MWSLEFINTLNCQTAKKACRRGKTPFVPDGVADSWSRVAETNCEVNEAIRAATCRNSGESELFCQRLVPSEQNGRPRFQKSGWLFLERTLAARIVLICSGQSSDQQNVPMHTQFLARDHAACQTARSDANSHRQKTTISVRLPSPGQTRASSTVRCILAILPRSSASLAGFAPASPNISLCRRIAQVKSKGACLRVSGPK